jgi:hypothetical protein
VRESTASRGSGPRGPTWCESRRRRAGRDREAPTSCEPPAGRRRAGRDREARLRARRRRCGAPRVGTERPDYVRATGGTASRESGPRGLTRCASPSGRRHAGRDREARLRARRGRCDPEPGPRGPTSWEQPAGRRRAGRDREARLRARRTAGRLASVPMTLYRSSRGATPDACHHAGRLRRAPARLGGRWWDAAGGCMARRAIERHRHTLHVSRRRLPGWCDGASRVGATAPPGLERRRLPGWGDGASRVGATAPPGLERRRLPGWGDGASRVRRT